MSYLTYQDFCAAGDRADFVRRAVAEHRTSSEYRIALDADEYDRQKNVTISHFVKTILSGTGVPVIDVTAANNRITSNFFRRLNTQRNTYSVGGGLSFADETVKPKLGRDIDKRIRDAGYAALIHGVSFLFWNFDRVYVFRLTEFKPLWDEETNALRAGVRFWQAGTDKPVFAVLYEEDGYTKFKGDPNGEKFSEIQAKTPYRTRTYHVKATGETTVIGGGNYGALPIVPLWGSELHQSTLVGMRESIDSYDLIRSGFANDLTDCAQIYWIIKNAGGMSERDLAAFREKLLFRHIANVDGDEGDTVTPYTQEIPFQARSAYLDRIRQGIYEDFGALDVTSISSASKTATEITAAYQPLDENADDYEYQIIECIGGLLALQGTEGEKAVPQFKRNRIANQSEETKTVMLAANYLDDKTVLQHLPWLTVDEVTEILARRDAEDQSRFTGGGNA